MKGFIKSCAFASFFVLSYTITKVQSAPSGSKYPELYSQFHYEKETNPINISRDYHYTPRNIQANIDKHINDSDVSVNFFEDKTDLNEEFKNETYYKKDYHKNSTDEEFFHLGNENLNQTQSTNNTQHLRVFNDSSAAKQFILQGKGNSKTTGDFYSDRGLLTNVSVRTYDDDMETVDVDKARQVEEVRKKFSSLGDLRYVVKNQSNSETKERSEYFSKNKHSVKDPDLEKNFQDSYFNQSKKIGQKSKNKRNMEKERVTKSKSQDYKKDNVTGVETLRKECLSHLHRENVFGDGKTEVKSFKTRKNRKSSFSKRLNSNSSNDGKWVTFRKYIQDCHDVLPESSISNVTIPSTDSGSSSPVEQSDTVAPDFQENPTHNDHTHNIPKGQQNDEQLKNDEDLPVEDEKNEQNQPHTTEKDLQKEEDLPVDDENDQNQPQPTDTDLQNDKDFQTEEDLPVEDEKIDESQPQPTDTDLQNDKNLQNDENLRPEDENNDQSQSDPTENVNPSLRRSFEDSPEEDFKRNESNVKSTPKFLKTYSYNPNAYKPIASQETTLLDAGYGLHLRNQKTVLRKSPAEIEDDSIFVEEKQSDNPYLPNLFGRFEHLIQGLQNSNKCKRNDSNCRKLIRSTHESPNLSAESEEDTSQPPQNNSSSSEEFFADSTDCDSYDANCNDDYLIEDEILTTDPPIEPHLTNREFFEHVEENETPDNQTRHFSDVNPSDSSSLMV